MAEAIGDHLAESPEQGGSEWQELLFEALAFLRLAERFGDHSLCDLTRHGRGRAVLGLRNLIPADFLVSRFAAAHASVLFSATLSPGHYQRDLLGLPETTVWQEVVSPFAAEHDPSMWTVELFVEEIGALRAALELERVHLLGQSWGAMLAMEYALTQPTGLVSLVCHSGLASAPAYEAGARALLDRLGQFLDQFTDCFSRRVQRNAASQYLQGLFNDSERKSMQAMHGRLSQPIHYQALQHFVTHSPWRDAVLWDRLNDVIPERRGVLAIDDTGLPKQGKHSVGVKRQYSGTLGKTGNCQVAVSSLLIGSALVLQGDFWALILHGDITPVKWEGLRWIVAFIFLAPLIASSSVPSSPLRYSGAFARTRRAPWIAYFASASSCRPRRSASATAATTRRRPWRSSSSS